MKIRTVFETLSRFHIESVTRCCCCSNHLLRLLSWNNQEPPTKHQLSRLFTTRHSQFSRKSLKARRANSSRLLRPLQTTAVFLEAGSQHGIQPGEQRVQTTNASTSSPYAPWKRKLQSAYHTVTVWIHKPAPDASRQSEQKPDATRSS